MSKNKVTILMLFVIVIGVYQSGINVPLSMGSYSPPAAIYMQDTAEDVLVFGKVYYSNGTYAEGMAVRLYATDQLIENEVITGPDGFFISTIYFRAGQILTIVLDNDYSTRSSVFIVYEAENDFDLGMFIVWL